MKNLNEKKVFEYWNVSEVEYSDLYDEIIENQRRTCLDEKKVQIIVRFSLNLCRKQLKKKLKTLYFQN